MNYKIILYRLLSLIAAFGVHYGYSQTCGMDHYHGEWRAAHPHFVQLEKMGETLDDRDVNRRNTVRIIPVVFHVLHTNGTENISDEQILDQLRILNEDFRRLNQDRLNVRNTANAPFAPLITDMEVEFRLAKRDPEGQCTNGINRIFTPLHREARDNVKNLVRWNVNNYLNIWVVSTISNSGQGGDVLGYANFPFMSAATDGIVIRSDEVGSIGTGNRNRSGRTLTHEVGHYLGLFHTFQNSCTGGGGQPAGDGIDDTPPVQSSESNRGCSPTANSCPGDSRLDQWENYMDYSLGCQSMFSHGQKGRVNYWFQNAPRRANLISEANMVVTGINAEQNAKPTAFFSSSRREVCTGEPVTFFDQSCGGQVVQRNWSFTGADVVTSSQPNPTVVYNSPGFYKVKLTVSNSFGNSEIELVNYIRVENKVATLSGIEEGFENVNFFSAQGIVQPDIFGFNAFEITERAAHFGKRAIVAPVTSQNIGARFLLETPSFDISKMANQNPKISFMVGYARRNSTNNEVLRIYVSDDCGQNWQQRLVRIGQQLASRSLFITDFVPQITDDWMRVVFSLSEYGNATNVKLRIEIESGGGNPVYIDDINVSQYFTSVESIEKHLQVEVYPNPSHDAFHIKMHSLKPNTLIDMEVTDVSGRVVARLFDDYTLNGQGEYTFYPANLGMQSGVYFLKLKTNEGILTKKLIFAH